MEGGQASGTPLTNPYRGLQDPPTPDPLTEQPPWCRRHVPQLRRALYKWLRHAATPLACLLPSAAVIKKLNFHLLSHSRLSRRLLVPPLPGKHHRPRLLSRGCGRSGGATRAICGRRRVHFCRCRLQPVSPIWAERWGLVGRTPISTTRRHEVSFRVVVTGGFFLGGDSPPAAPPTQPEGGGGCQTGGVQSPRGFIHWGDAARCHPLPGAFRKKEKKQSPVSKPTRVMGAPRVPGELLGCWIRPVCIPAAVAPSRWSGDGFPLPGPRAQHWLHGGGPPARRVSRDSMVPVGVGGVTMMEGTCRFFSLGDAAGVLSLPFPLLTHVFKPAKMGGGRPKCVCGEKIRRGAAASPSSLPSSGPPCPAQPLTSH